MTKTIDKDLVDQILKLPQAPALVEELRHVLEEEKKKTESRDRGIKFEDYQNHSLEEYWIIIPEQRIVEQYQLKNETYELVMKSGNGEIESLAVPGFKIPIQAIFDKQLNLKLLAKFLS